MGLPAQKSMATLVGKGGEAPRPPVRGAGAEPTMMPPKEPAAKSTPSGKVPAAPKQTDKKPDKPAAAAAGEANIVSIDAFRKKP
jgi:hypothetical protein